MNRLKDKAVLMITSAFFCLGFLIVIIDSYYDYNYYYYLDMGRNDIIERLEFLSWNKGFIYYPAIVPIFIISSLLLKHYKMIIIRKQIFYMLASAVIVGALFYTRSIDFIVLQYVPYWIIGLILMASSVYGYNQGLVSKQERREDRRRRRSRR